MFSFSRSGEKLIEFVLAIGAMLADDQAPGRAPYENDPLSGKRARVAVVRRRSSVFLPIRDITRCGAKCRARFS